MSSLVITEKEGGTGILTLNRVDKQNSLVPDFLEAIQAGFESLVNDSQVEVVILQAAGKVFSTGGDVRGFRDHFSDIKAYSEKVVGGLNHLILSIIKSPIPVIAAVHGMVTGGSIGLTLASDLMLVSPKTSFTPYYSIVGFSPDGGWTAILPTIIGRIRAAGILMQNETITAEQAVDWGLANRLVAEDDIGAEARRMAEGIIQKKAGSIVKTKKRLWSDIDTIAQALNDELRLFVDQIQTLESQEGVKQFLGER